MSNILLSPNQKYNVEPGAIKGDRTIAVQTGSNPGTDGSALENVDPTLSIDAFRWIPKGLMLDLIDNTPGEYIVNDKVSGYTIQQIFAALQSDISSIPAYKARLTSQNLGNQITQVTNLFAQYHY